MTHSMIHFGSCKVWETGSWANCTCHARAAWRIRKDPAEQFPWRIWRHTNDGCYEPLMRCSSFEGARQLVLQLEWLRENAMKRNADV